MPNVAPSPESILRTWTYLIALVTAVDEPSLADLVNTLLDLKLTAARRLHELPQRTPDVGRTPRR